MGLVIVLVIGVLLIGPILALVALGRSAETKGRASDLETRVRWMEMRIQTLERKLEEMDRKAAVAEFGQEPPSTAKAEAPAPVVEEPIRHAAPAPSLPSVLLSNLKAEQAVKPVEDVAPTSETAEASRS